MKGSLLGYMYRKFEASSFQILFAPLIYSLLAALAAVSCGFVDEAGEGVNTPPTVSLQTGDVTADEQTVVTLTSSATDDFDSVESISWVQVSGPDVDLQNEDSEVASFNAPEVLVHQSPTLLEFRVTVRDNFGQEASDNIVVLVKAVNKLPLANDDSGLVVNEGQPNEPDDPTVPINVTENDSDEDGSVSPAGIMIVSPPKFGQAVPNDDGTISYDHDGTEPSAELGTDTDSFSYRVKDNETVLADQDQLGEALIYSNEATVSITITPVNDRPTAQAKSLNLSEDPPAPVQAILGASDPDSTFTVSLVNANDDDVQSLNIGSGTVEITSDAGDYTYQPEENFFGTDSFTYRVSDGELDASGVVTITVEAVNDPPVITGQQSLSTMEEVSFTVDLAGLEIEDPDGDDSFTLMVLNGNNYSVSGTRITPALDFDGTLAVRVTVDDGNEENSTSNIFNLTVNVADVNDPPVITGQDPLSTPEDRPLTIRVSNLVIDDPDDTSFNLTVQGGANYSVSGDTITPADEFNGRLTVPVTVNDGMANSNVFNLIVTVTQQNDPPVITGQAALSTMEETPLTIALNNLTVTDPDSDFPADFSLDIQNGANYSVSGSTITPNINFEGTLSVPVQVNDGSDASNAFRLTITVTGVNDAPVITGQKPLSTPDGTPLMIGLTDLIVTDPDNRFPGDFSLAVQDGANYSVSGTTIIPDDPEFSGTLTVPVSVNDGSANSNVFSLAVQVISQNDPPVAVNDTGITVNEGASVPINVIVNDTDSDGTLAQSTIAIATPPGNGTAVANANGTVTYTHDGTETTSDSFTYTVQDNEGATSNVATVSITINPVNDPPVITGQTPNPLVTQEQTPLTITLANVEVTDPDSTFPGGFTLTVVGDGGSFSRDPGNPNTVIPNEGFTGNMFPLVIVNDGSNDSVAVNLAVSVVSAAEASFRSQEGLCWTTPQEQPLEASLADPQASASAMYRLVTDGAKGSLTVTDPVTGAFRYTPHAQGERGVDSFTYQIDDPLDELKTKTATVIVDPKIMIVGDSISAGLSDGANLLPATGQRVGFRQPLYETLLGESYGIDLVGGERDGEGVSGFDPDHEAHLDWTAAELAWGRNPGGSEGVFAWLEARPADLVLVHAGSYGLTSSVDQVSAMLDEIDRWEASANGNPVTVVVARIIDREPSDQNISLFNANLEAMVLERASNPAHPSYPDDVLVADLHGALSYPQDLSDGMHPSAQGYAKMAETWKKALTDNALLERCP